MHLHALIPLLEAAYVARQPLLSELGHGAYRLFSGFVEGEPNLVVDCYAQTLLFHNYAPDAAQGLLAVEQALAYYQSVLPFTPQAVVKSRRAAEPSARRGVVLAGTAIAHEVREAGVAYAVDLLLNRDGGFYPDTRSLRRWLRSELAGARVLNTFAYTGSLGVAALAGGAREVVQLDRAAHFLALAEQSVALNPPWPGKHELIAADFFRAVAQLRRAERQFECVILDPPFFAQSGAGTVDLLAESARLINKVRPLVADNGRLVVVNNALFLAGSQFYATLDALTTDGYVQIEQLIAIDADCAPPPDQRQRPLPSDPAPFNHATKIAVLRLRRKKL